MVRDGPRLIRRWGVRVRAALLALCAAVAYAVGWCIGRVVSFALWLWAAALHGYKDGL